MVAPNTLTEMARRESSNNSTPQRSASGGDDSDSELDEENNRPRGSDCWTDFCVQLKCLNHNNMIMKYYAPSTLLEEKKS